MAYLLNAFQITWRSGRLLLVIYLTSLILGLLAALPFYGTLRAETAHSLAFDALLNGFDYTVVTDFMHEKGRAINPLLAVGRWVSIVFLFLSVFFTGGILIRFAKPDRPVQLGAFWQACSHYFRRYLGLFGLMVLLIGLLAFVWLLVGTLLVMSFTDTYSERELFWIGAGCLLGFVLMAVLVVCIGDYAKVDMLRRDESNALRAFVRASSLVFRYGKQTYGLYWLLLLAGTGWFAVYFVVDEVIGMHDWTAILLLFLVQQVFIVGRIGLKVAALGVAWRVSDRLVPPSPAVYAESVPAQTTTPPIDIPLTDTQIPPASETEGEEKATG